MAIDATDPAADALAESLLLSLIENHKRQNGEINGHIDGNDASRNSNQADSVNGVLETGTVNDEEADPKAGSIGSYHTIYRIKINDNEYSWTTKEPEDAVEAAENVETAKFAVILRSQKSSDSRKKFEAHSIVVQSPWLKEALSDILKGYPGVSCELERLVFESPFKPFMHRWADLQAYLKRDLDAITKEHLALLNDILQQELRDDIKAYQDYISKGITTFAHAWMLFQPGDLIVSDSSGPLSAYELVDASYKTTQSGCVFLQLECHVIEWSGSEFGRFKVCINIPEFKGTDKITNLSAFPISFHADKENVKLILIERGKKFESLAGHQFRSYDGIAIDWDNEGREIAIHHNGRIVVDCKAFNRYSFRPIHATKELNDNDKQQLTLKDPKRRSNNLLKQGPQDDQGSAYHLSDYFRLLSHSRVRGYSLSLKKWLDFFVPWVADIEWNTRAFDSLVLPEDQKELILALAESQVQHRQGFDDTIQGKGQGIIILLSGKPGIGKTLTAESVAEEMRRPLHTISSGDLGNNPWDIERKLTQILERVGRWNAVLLLDECDVFLETRSTRDLARNSMVGTFLRTLEYYRGILFLTTNRADNIDPAFESRIHVSLQYPDLTADSRKKIWANFLSGQDHELSEEDLNELAALEVNGRQIKNIIKTSHLLSARKKQKLNRKDVNTVLKIEDIRPERKEQR